MIDSKARLEAVSAAENQRDISNTKYPFTFLT